MSVTLLFVALVVFAFFATHLINRYASRFLPVSGAEYLVIGALIGPQIPLGVLSTDSLLQLTPVVSLLLGLSGFLVGLQARRSVRHVRSSLVGLAVALSTLLGLAAVFAVLYGWILPAEEAPLLQKWLFRVQGYQVELFFTWPQLAVAVVLAAAGTITFSATLSGLDGDRRLEVPAYRLLGSCAFYGQVVAIAAVAAILVWARSRTAVVELPAAGWFFGVLALGVVLGVCFTLFVGHEQSTSRIFVATVGTVTFGAGVGTELGVSPLFVNLVAGATVVFTSRDHGNLRRELERLRHPISVLLLVLTGALWVAPERSVFWLFPPVYLASRWFFRMTLPGLWTRALTRIDASRIGVGLLSQGTLAVAVGVDYALQVPSHAGVVLTTVIVGTLVFDVFAQGALKRYLVDAEAEHAPATTTASFAAHEVDA
jgi:Kef-type K+ transport system membrane component KefB